MAPLRCRTGICQCFYVLHPLPKKKDCWHRKPEVQVVEETWEERWHYKRGTSLPQYTKGGRLV
eukprot:13691819-Ditylum_brightwellii.AAC.1